MPPMAGLQLERLVKHVRDEFADELQDRHPAVSQFLRACQVFSFGHPVSGETGIGERIYPHTIWGEHEKITVRGDHCPCYRFPNAFLQSASHYAIKQALRNWLTIQCGYDLT